MQGISFIQGFPLPPIDIVLQALGTNIVGQDSGLSVLHLHGEKCELEVQDFVRVDTMNNCVVVLREKVADINQGLKYRTEKRLGPLELVSKLLHAQSDGSPDYYDPKYNFEEAFQWMLKSIPGYDAHLGTYIATPIFAADYDYQTAMEEARKICGTYERPFLPPIYVNL